MLVTSLLKGDIWAVDITDPQRIAKQKERNGMMLTLF